LEGIVKVLWLEVKGLCQRVQRMLAAGMANWLESK
jgi:hypothetical protein